MADTNERPRKRPAARGNAFYPRKRANTACQVCRARKTKCDNAKPSCSYCLSVGASCIQSPFDLSSFDPASLRILERLDELEHLLREKDEAAKSGESGMPRLHAELNHHETPIPHYVTPSTNQHERLRIQHITHDHEVTPPASAIQIPLLRSVLPERLEQILEWTSTSEIPGSPFSSLTTSPVHPCHSSSPGTGTTVGSLAAGLAELEPHGINELLDRFFMHVHCKNPILDETETRRLVRRAFLEGLDWSPASCLTMLICALGCISTPLGPSHEVAPGTQAYRDGEGFFNAAQKRMGPLFLQPSIIGTQCLFLSGVYLMSVFRPRQAWRYFCQALAACQDLSFLARNNNSQINTPTAAEISADEVHEQAVYWSAWKSEREVRQELSLPDFPTSSGTHYPTFFPTPPPPSVGTPDGFTDPVDLRARGSWLFYLSEISLRRLNSRLCSEISTLHQKYSTIATTTTNPPSSSGAMADTTGATNISSTGHFLQVLSGMIPEYESQAQQWADSLPHELSIRHEVTQMEDHHEEHICRAVLRGHLYNLWELIYWPFVMATIELLAVGKPHHKHPQFVQDICQRGLQAHVHRLHINQPVFFHRHHGTWFMMRCCTRSALVLAVAASHGARMPAGWLEAVKMTLEMLEYWSTEVPGVREWAAAIERQIAKAAN
ncbi:c6 zinc finger domain-containing [Apiospora arundinis]|uniref:C6 zinc finger domain-containing n=1 Tax=Apiospora arundinis TaxID=335852 RepID=A0ABR2JDB7_9PEZI